MRDAIVLTIRKNIQRIIIENDSWLVINVINGKICIPKELVMLLRMGFYHLYLETLKLNIIIS